MNPTGQSRETDASLLIRFGHRKQYGLTVGLGDDHNFLRCNVVFCRDGDLLQRLTNEHYISFQMVRVAANLSIQLHRKLL